MLRNQSGDYKRACPQAAMFGKKCSKYIYHQESAYGIGYTDIMQGDLFINDSKAVTAQPESNLLRNQCISAISEWIKLAETMPAAQGNEFPMPEVLFNLKGLSAGIAVFNRRSPERSQIRINEDLLERYPDEMLNHTVPHEVAHIVTAVLYGKLDHGPAWQSVMAFFDRPATRCHQMQAEPARRHKKHRYQCQCGEHMVGSKVNTRISKGKVYLCSKCTSPLKAVASDHE